MDIKIDFPIWVIVVFLSILIIPPILSGFGIFYLLTRRFDRLSLVLSTVIFLCLEILIFLSYFDGHFPGPWTGTLGFPFSVLSFFVAAGNFFISSVFSIIGIALNYLAIFSVVNFVSRVLKKLTAK